MARAADYFFDEDASMMHRQMLWTALLPLLLTLGTGCYSPYRADRGALVGGVGGAGVGALVGNAVGHPVVGALVGSGVGAVSGAAIGGAIDQSEANNRALIEARLGRPVAAGAVSVGDVINMTQAGVAENVMITHIQTHGMVGPLSAQDLITLKQFNVNPRVVQVMQVPPQAVARPVIVGPVMPAPVVYSGPMVGPGGVYGTWRPIPPPVAMVPVAPAYPTVAAAPVAATVPTPPTPMPPPAQ
jgi:Glycine zipper